MKFEKLQAVVAVVGTLVLGGCSSGERADSETNDELGARKPVAVDLETLAGTWWRKDVAMIDYKKATGIVDVSVEHPTNGGSGCHVGEHRDANEDSQWTTFAGNCRVVDAAAFNEQIAWTGGNAKPSFEGWFLLVDVKNVTPGPTGEVRMAYAVRVERNVLQIASVGSARSDGAEKRIAVSTAPNALKFFPMEQ
jgi:hypothetical protein